MSTQHLSTLIALQKYSQSFQSTFLKYCPKDLIQFLNECIVNLLRGELKEIQKQEVLVFREEIHLLILKRTSLKKRRQILSSKKGISLISILTPSIVSLEMDQFVLIPQQLYDEKTGYHLKNWSIITKNRIRFHKI